MGAQDFERSISNALKFETDAIFEQVRAVNANTDVSHQVQTVERLWRGELSTSTDKALGLARTMTYHGIMPSTVIFAKDF